MSAGSYAKGWASQQGKNAEEGRVDMTYLKIYILKLLEQVSLLKIGCCWNGSTGLLHVYEYM